MSLFIADPKNIFCSIEQHYTDDKHKVSFIDDKIIPIPFLCANENMFTCLIYGYIRQFYDRSCPVVIMCLIALYNKLPPIIKNWIFVKNKINTCTFNLSLENKFKNIFTLSKQLKLYLEQESFRYIRRCDSFFLSSSTFVETPHPVFNYFYSIRRNARDWMKFQQNVKKIIKESKTLTFTIDIQESLMYNKELLLCFETTYEDFEEFKFFLLLKFKSGKEFKMIFISVDNVKWTLYETVVDDHIYCVTREIKITSPFESFQLDVYLLHSLE